MKNVFFVILLFLTPIFCIFGNGVSSLMSSGDWYKITIARDGIYRITYSELVNLGIADPANVRIYGIGGGMLPEIADKNTLSDLQEIPVWMHTRDGTFRSGDYILFYGQGPAVWRYDTENQEFEHAIHLWDSQSCYFITSKAGGKRIATETPPTTAITQNVTSFDERQYYENELWNLLKSGRYWYGEDFYSTTTRRFTFNVPDLESEAWLNMAFMAATNSPLVQLQVVCNEQQIAMQPLQINLSNHIATAVAFNTAKFNPPSSNLSVELNLVKNGAESAGGWLDYIRLFARRRLNMSESQLFFRDTQSLGEEQTANFHITGSNSNIHVWDISDMHNVQRMNTTLSGNTMTFSASTERLREFVAFNITSDLLIPNFPDGNRRTNNQNLHGIENVDMIIVTHPDFLEAAHELAALHRRDGLSVETVTAEQVYNEFSSGMQDPAAIRNFMKYLYEKPSTVKLKYLLLMGAGTYNNKSIETGLAFNPNFIVTYQSENSWHGINSFVSDDYFGILGDGEAVLTGRLYIGVGRLPVRSSEQAHEAVEKTRRYMDALLSGDWQNMIGLLADAGDDNLHTEQSEELAKYMSENHPQYTVEKMYLEGFPREVTTDGHRYPEIEENLVSLINSGCLLVNYIGHGNTSGLTAARVINNTSISQWRNKLYPIFVAATCNFGRFDDEDMSGSEIMLLSPNGGSIAMLTGTRLVYSYLNIELNHNFFKEMFTHPTTGDEEHRLGDILRRAKNATESATIDQGVNKLSFALLGNPALKPVIPPYTVRTGTVNVLPEIEPLDALKANSFVTIRGAITDNDNIMIDNFNGILYFSLFDKPREHQTLNHSESKTVLFQTQTSTLHKGKAVVENGEFEISFFIPRNINYKFGAGKISYFVISDDGQSAAGSLKVNIGGSVPGSGNTEGPQIQLFMNDTYFRDGGITDQNPMLIAYLQDETGINTSEEGIGHNITARLSNAPSTVYILNRYYETELGYHNKGVVNYRFTNLPVGNYELLFTAWNLENNPAQETIKFRVTQSTTLKIDNLYNYPNPFTERTRIYFEFNMPDTEIQVELQIFDMSGRLLRSIKKAMHSEGYTSGDFEWDGRDSNGNRMNTGIYPYRVILTTKNGQVEWQASRMAIR